jgi:hypothetical protein
VSRRVKVPSRSNSATAGVTFGVARRTFIQSI